MPTDIVSVTCLSLSGGRKVTVWRKETGVLKEYEHGDVIGTVVMQSTLTPSKLADHVLKNLPRAVECEVIEGNGNGVRMKKV
jgi:hypothetical protein